MGPGEQRIQRTTFVRLVRVGSRPRVRKVDSYARVKLEDAARRGPIPTATATPQQATDRAYAVGDMINVYGRWWEVLAVCYQCQHSGWVLLRPQRGLDEEGILPPLRTRPCTHASKFNA